MPTRVGAQRVSGVLVHYEEEKDVQGVPLSITQVMLTVLVPRIYTSDRKIRDTKVVNARRHD